MNIGKIQRVNLREIWKNEARDFTTWLSENLDVLGDTLHLSLALVQKEKEVGTFSLDILAENEQGELVIIENQLEKTDHDHLGKMLTYLSNLNASLAIWVTSHPREEHKKAVDWLNENSPNTIGFYLVKIEAIQINDSAAAPLFTIESEPTEIAKSVGKEKRELAERAVVQKEFWTQLLDVARQHTKLYANISPQPYHWIGAGIGKTGTGINMTITKSKGQVEVYLDRGNGSQDLNKKRFDILHNHKDKIEKSFGAPLVWERMDKKRASRISFRYEDAGLDNRDKWDDLQHRMIKGAAKLYEAVKPYIADLP